VIETRPMLRIAHLPFLLLVPALGCSKEAGPSFAPPAHDGGVVRASDSSTAEVVAAQPTSVAQSADKPPASAPAPADKPAATSTAATKDLGQAQAEPAPHTEAGPQTHLASVPFDQIKLREGFWSHKLETNRKVTLEACLAKCEETGRIKNFAIAGGLEK